MKSVSKEYPVQNRIYSIILKYHPETIQALRCFLQSNTYRQYCINFHEPSAKNIYQLIGKIFEKHEDIESKTNMYGLRKHYYLNSLILQYIEEINAEE